MHEQPSTMTASSSQRTLATRLSAFAAFIAGGLFLAVVSTLIGFGSFNGNAPIPTYVRQHAVFSLLVVGVVFLACVAGWLLARRPSGRLVLSAGLPIAGYALFGLLLLLVVARPGWCPTALCPAPGIVTTAHGVNDGTMEIYYTTQQSGAYVIPGDPAQYSLSNLPAHVAALRIGGGSETEPYRLVIGAHSLLRSGYSIFIERVEVLVTQVPVTPNPLHVFVSAPATTYQSNLYRVLYQGEAAGITLPATYLTVPHGHTMLAPGEADDLDIQMTANVPSDLRFKVRVTYRVADQSAEHSLTLPDVFEVVFADGSNWHPYQLANGHLVPSK